MLLLIFFFLYQFDRHLGMDFLSNTGCNLSLSPLEYVSSNQFLTTTGSWALKEFWPVSPSTVAHDCWFSWGLTYFDLTRILAFNVSYFGVSGMWHFKGCTSELWCVFMAVGSMKIQWNYYAKAIILLEIANKLLFFLSRIAAYFLSCHLEATLLHVAHSG